jgi:DNA-binding NtrC family response regulator
VVGLRDQILKLHGYEVDSTLSLSEALVLSTARDYSLVLIDVEGDGRVPMAEELCGEIKTAKPEQKVVFICNYRVSAETDCPDEIIRAEFNPRFMLEGLSTFLDQQ